MGRSSAHGQGQEGEEEGRRGAVACRSSPASQTDQLPRVAARQRGAMPQHARHSVAPHRRGACGRPRREMRRRRRRRRRSTTMGRGGRRGRGVGQEGDEEQGQSGTASWGSIRATEASETLSTVRIGRRRTTKFTAAAQPNARSVRALCIFFDPLHVPCVFAIVAVRPLPHAFGDCALCMPDAECGGGGAGGTRGSQRKA